MQIIGFIGKAGSGKNEACSILSNIYTELGYNPITIAFAEPLKELCQHLFGFAYDLPSSAFYGTYEQKEHTFPSIGISGREILQKVGTDFFRNTWPDIWAMYLKKTIPILEMQGYNVILVSDARFQNEVDVLKEMGGKIVRIERYEVDGSPRNAGIPGHASETEHQAIVPDVVIANNSSLLDLSEELLKLVDR